MARPRKNKTVPTRIPVFIRDLAKKKAKKKGMSLPDFIAWSLSK